MGFSFLGFIALVGLYWVFSVHDAFEKQRSWTCRNYSLVCRNLNTCLTCDTLTAEELKRVFSSRQKPVVSKNQKEIE